MRPNHPNVKDDEKGISSAVRDFNSHCGPARIFYNRNSGTFFVRTYSFGGDRLWGRMSDGLDIVELYRKTSGFPDVKVTDQELRMMEHEVGPYSVW